MKKILIMVAFSFAICSTVFAAGTTASLSLPSPLTTGTTGLSLFGGPASFTYTAGVTPLIGKTSTGVAVGVLTAATGYAMVTQHLNGTKEFGTSFDSTSMYQATLITAPGVPLLVIPATADSGSFVATGSAWSAM
jgi:hypothetical protein